jgi:hypothetical protein
VHNGLTFNFAAKLQDFLHLLTLSAADVQRLTRLSTTDVSNLQVAIAESIPQTPCISGKISYISFCSLHRLSHESGKKWKSDADCESVTIRVVLLRYAIIILVQMMPFCLLNLAF